MQVGSSSWQLVHILFIYLDTFTFYVLFVQTYFKDIEARDLILYILYLLQCQQHNTYSICSCCWIDSVGCAIRFISDAVFPIHPHSISFSEIML